MAKRHFRLSEDVYAPGRWYLGDPVDEASVEVEDPWMFSAGRSIQAPSLLRFPIDEPGKPLDYSGAGIGSPPIIHVKLATVFAELAPEDLQLFAVDIPGHPEQFSMLVATRLIRCIDDKASREVEYWDPIKHKQPEKAGQYASVAGMRIDPSKVGNAKVFRTWGWKFALIVSEDIKTALERTGATGMSFTEV
ncbi:imm11 family protein [Corallococcus exercitus]|uniref:imm11 family protein n=1 Tax=Corallococcus exercitus TaxID=2316736 RepID=UPI0035D4371B